MMQKLICQIQIFHPATSAPIPPAKTVMSEKSHSPRDAAALAIWRYRSGAIYRSSQLSGCGNTHCHNDSTYLRTI